ncbi:MAG: glycosyltransferase [Minisyncoccia bacterium]
MILIITPDIFGPVKGGGIGTAFYNLALFLTNKGYKVEILYVLGNYRETKEDIEYWQKFYEKIGINFIPLKDKKFEKVASHLYRDYAYKVYLWLKENQRRYKIIIFPEWQGSLYYVLLAKKISLEFLNNIFVVNTHSPEMWAYLGNYKLPDFVDLVERDFMEKKCIEWADVLVSPSAYLLNWMKKCGYILPKESYIIPNVFYKNEIFNGEEREASFGKIRELIFFGRLEIRKGLKLFIDALYKVEDSFFKDVKKITFLGKALRGNFDSVSYIKTLIKPLKEKHDFEIEIISDKNREDALKILSNRKREALILIPALVENLPYVVFECLELRLRFGVSKVGGIPEMIDESFLESVTFEPNPTSLAKFLMKAIEKDVPIPKPSKFLIEGETKWLDLIEELIEKKALLERTKKNYLFLKPSNGPLVSVCLVHYERPNFIEKALESLLVQTYKNFEVVLVDDGSRSKEALEKLSYLEENIFKPRNWKIVKQENKYLGAARNNGVRHSSGEYIFFLDDDNRLVPEALEKFVEVALETSGDIVTSALWYGEDLDKKEDLKIWSFLGQDLGGGVFRNVFGDASALWKKESFLKIGGFSENYGIGHEDWEIYVRAVLLGLKLVYIPEPLVLYRVSQSGMLRSGNFWMNHVRSFLPYYEINPQGLGTALGYALTLHLSKIFQESYLSENNEKSLIIKSKKVFNAIVNKPELIKKFFVYTKERGFFYSLKKVYEFLKSS